MFLARATPRHKESNALRKKTTPQLRIVFKSAHQAGARVRAMKQKRTATEDRKMKAQIQLTLWFWWVAWVAMIPGISQAQGTCGAAISLLEPGQKFYRLKK
jgi:hypothetical protein